MFRSGSFDVRPGVGGYAVYERETWVGSGRESVKYRRISAWYVSPMVAAQAMCSGEF